MSSHHIVRDEQEPALLVAQKGMLDAEGMGSLLEWSPTVMVISSVLETVLTWGIKVDVVIGYEEETHALREQLQKQSPVKLLTITKGGDLLATGLVYLLQNQYSAVNLLADLHRNGKAVMGAVHEVAGVLDVVVYSQQHKCWTVKGNRFQKWMPKGQTFHLVPTKLPQRLSTQGLYPHFVNELWQEAVQVTTQEAGSVLAEATGPFWVYEKIDE